MPGSSGITIVPFSTILTSDSEHQEDAPLEIGA
jgi:hypothetical protein